MTNVNIIKGILNAAQGPALPCYYTCNIVPPTAFSSSGTLGSIIPGAGALLQPLIATASRQVSLLAESVSIPGRQLLTTEHKIFGTKRLMPYGVLYENMTITFICTNIMLERTFFDIWHQFIISPGSQYMEYYKDYVGEIVIQKISNDDPTTAGGALTEFGSLLSTYTLEEAYPVSIQAQELSYGSNEEYLKLTVEFAYAKWKCTLDQIFTGPSNVPRTV